MTGGEPQAVAGILRWCKVCKQQVQLTGRSLFPEFARAVHLATGMETGADGHLVRPTLQDPALRAEADLIEAEFPKFKVTVLNRIFRAAWRQAPPFASTEPVDAPGADELRIRLRAVLAGLDVAP